MKSTLLTSLVACLALAGISHAATLIHSWDFEGDYLDDVGGANGSVTGGTNVGSTTGFDGGTAAIFTIGRTTDHLVNIAPQTAVTTPISGFSITYWVKMADDGISTQPAGNRGFFDFSANGTDSGYQGLYLGGDEALNFRVDNGLNGNNVVIKTTTVDIEDDAWHHIALTFTPGVASNGFQAYLDGASLTNVHASGGNTTGFSSGDIDALTPYLGSYNLSTTQNHSLNGALDDFQIWSDVLTSTEISNLASVPEPSTGLLGLLGVAALLRRRR